MSLIGGKEFTWGKKYRNPPTEKQISIIDKIHAKSTVRFSGRYSNEAYIFINKNKHILGEK